MSYLYYRLINKERKTDPNTQSDRSFWIALYGTVLSGCVGGLLAIVFDRAIELSILVGFLHHILYTSIIKSAKDDHFLSVLKEILIKYLTAGKQA